MLTSSSESEDTSSISLLETEYEVQIESQTTEEFKDGNDIIQPHFDEPIGNEEWLKTYQEKKNCLKAQFDGKIAVRDW